MLYGNFAESRTPGTTEAQDWTVRLYRDDIPTMRILLKVMHGRTADVPITFKADMNPLTAVYKLAVWADKYDCVAVLKPWVSLWAYSLKFKEYKGSDIRTFSRVPWVMWTFGDQHNYKLVKDTALAAIPRWTSSYMLQTSFEADVEAPEFRSERNIREWISIRHCMLTRAHYSRQFAQGERSRRSVAPTQPWPTHQL